MKKNLSFKIFVAVLCLAFAVSSSFALKVIPKAGVDIPGTMNYEKGADGETKLGFMVGVEARANISDYFGWGAGLEYMLPRGLVDVAGDNDFSLLPLYASLLFYPFGGWEQIKPYIKINAGYSVFAATQAEGDMSGGLYWGAGLGAEYKNFIGEVVYASYDAEYEDLGLSYQKIGFVFGYKFNIELSKKSE
jgi:hypothetical protein